MRSTCCLYIDTGYLLASAATRATGTSLRNGIHVQYGSLVKALISTAENLSGLPVLRVYWYDSATNGVPSHLQERIGELSKVKLRLGRFGYNGEQKGVDLRIGLDLVTHARNNASDVFFLVSGDDDLTEAVEEAQVHGVQVVVLGVPNAQGKPHGVNKHLIRAADDLHTIDAELIDDAVVKIDRQAMPDSPCAPAAPAVDAPKPGPHPAAPKPSSLTPLDVANHRVVQPPTTAPKQTGVLAYSSSTGSNGHVMPGYDVDAQDDMIEPVVDRVLISFLESASPVERQDLLTARPSIPRDVDRALLIDASEALDVDDLDETVRHRLRAKFWERYDAQ
ncbi:Uncharacterized conserved protein, LabA/DUF88 family [Gordonia malaquae]|uniref:NYN domain-containing protein n=1 Tax=Gordonia malaquae NBRC 108250 TaxID=1223542 RepID=M3THF1_GORML|nr:NYN domain-containing protein [Gordonia malaquae]GAC80906.1 hypothetical protein GM1_024_00250 [Gordonia malaquae NBRC 108250]SED70151.1 Uncharacterized conserved protein, LabA/DUF88 family [Gordonia malaquae]